ncbi:MAG: hypothetical protein LUE31_11535 [Lachnospiraceae bacterium]|nr:hypothetical protein [Lachnospiraceae bacterium]
MSIIDATVSMLEVMPEEARVKVMEFTQRLFVSKKPENPYAPLTTEQVLQDLAESRQQIAEGKARPMDEVLDDLEQRYSEATKSVPLQDYVNIFANDLQ